MDLLTENEFGDGAESEFNLDDDSVLDAVVTPQPEEPAEQNDEDSTFDDLLRSYNQERSSREPTGSPKAEPAGPPESQAKFDNLSEHEEKVEILAQLARLVPDLEQRGFTIDLPLPRLRYELDRINDLDNEVSQVEIYFAILLIVVAILQYVVTKFIKVLDLSQWTERVQRQKKQYKRPFRKLYMQHFRKKKMSPYSEIGLLLLASAAQTHMDNKNGRNANTKPEDVSSPQDTDSFADIPLPEGPKSKNNTNGGAGIGNIIGGLVQKLL